MWEQWFGPNGEYLGLAHSPRTKPDPVPKALPAFSITGTVKPQYAPNFHQCLNCGMTLRDDVLISEVEEVMLGEKVERWYCKDKRLCTKYKHQVRRARKT